MVVPDLAQLAQRLAKVAPLLQRTAFTFEDRGSHVAATCPWGNRFRCHAPASEFGDTGLALAYIEFDVPAGAAEGIARFYAEVMGAPGQVLDSGGARTASISAGRDQRLLFRETTAALPDYDGHHMQIYLADFSGPYKRLIERGLVTKETDAHEWRFMDIVDPQTDRKTDRKTTGPLFRIEHEVRSMKHPLFGRPLVNRNHAQSNSNYLRGQDTFRGIY
jgi:hypothetical protein